jgi:hypothetical protein
VNFILYLRNKLQCHLSSVLVQPSCLPAQHSTAQHSTAQHSTAPQKQKQRIQQNVHSVVNVQKVNMLTIRIALLNAFARERGEGRPKAYILLGNIIEKLQRWTPADWSGLQLCTTSFCCMIKQRRTCRTHTVSSQLTVSCGG